MSGQRQANTEKRTKGGETPHDIACQESSLRFLGVFFVVAVCFWYPAYQLRAEYRSLESALEVAKLRPGDEVWALSTRYQSAGPTTELEPLVSRLSGELCHSEPAWRTSSLADLLGGPPKRWLIFVHGNRTRQSDALAAGWDFYARLLFGSRAPPVRLVIWSWPSDPIHGIVRDVRCKAQRADAEAYLLMRFLEKLPEGSEVGLVGYSFGSRIICRAVHFWEPQSSATSSSQPPLPLRLRAGLLAGAMESDVLAVDGIYSDAVTKFEHVLVLYNSCDPVLKHFGVVENCQKLRAIGYVGVEGTLARDGVVWEYDVAPHIGRTHHLWHYFDSPTVMHMIGIHLFEK